MNLLNDFNTNLYLNLCSLLNMELNDINSFVVNIRKDKEYSKFLTLDQRYKDIFLNPVFDGLGAFWLRVVERMGCTSPLSTFKKFATRNPIS